MTRARNPISSHHQPAGDAEAHARPAEVPTAVAVPSHECNFNWIDDDSIVLREQAAIAVYRNQNGGLVIRQEKRWDEEDDTIIIISPDNIMPFIDKLTDVAGIPSVGKP